MKPTGDSDPFACFDCEVKFNNREEIVDHLMEEHGETEKEARKAVRDITDILESFEEKTKENIQESVKRLAAEEKSVKRN